MNEPTGTTTLRDYLRVLRQQRALIVIVALLCAGTALVLAVRKDPTYEAVAQMSFKDDSQALGVAGIIVQRSQEPAQVANQAAGTLTRDEVMLQVRRTLGLRNSLEDLQGRVTAAADPASNLVSVTAKARTAKLAADLANATATVARNMANERSRAAAKRQIVAVRRRLKTLGKNETDARRLQEEQLSRLQTLATFSAPATISARAATPSSPTSPKPVLSTMIGLFLGLLLGTGGAFVRTSLDRRLRRPTEIATALDLPLVGIVPVETLSVVPVPGVGEEAEDMEVFRILRSNVDFLDFDNPPRTVLVTSPLPEEGKTTAAIGLALSAAAAGRRTLLVECDLRRPVHAQRLGLAPSPGLTDFLTGAAQPADILQVRAVDPAVGGDLNGGGPGQQLVCIVAGSETPRPAEMLVSKRFREFLAQVSSAYELVVIDSPPLLPVADTLEVVPHVDAVLFCVRSTQTTRDQALAGVAALRRFPPRPTGLVVTGTRSQDDEVGGYYRYGYGYEETPDKGATVTSG